MLHGGGWAAGDKAGPENWRGAAPFLNARGLLYVKVNTRLLPEAGPAEQAADLAAAVAEVQARAPEWGGDPSRTVLMGHSSGGHVAALMASDTSLAPPLPLAGAVILDAGYLDVPTFMALPRAEVFLDAFGTDPAGWAALSPAERIGPDAPPFLLVCGVAIPATCRDNLRFAAAAGAVGVPNTQMATSAGHMALIRDFGTGPDGARIAHWIAERIAGP